MNSLELVFLEFKHIYKTQRTSLFSFYLFILYLLFHNHSAYQCPPPLRLFPLCVNTKDESSLFDCCFAITLCNKWTSSLKRNPLPCQFSWWSLIFLRLDLPQLKLECLNCQKSDIRTNSPYCNVLIWTSFCFLQVNQQKHVGIASTINNVIWTDQ